MKSVLTILCSLLLALTQVVQAQAPVSVVDSSPVCCPCKMPVPCCSARPASPVSQPVSATPVSSQSQNQLVSLAPASLAWTLPAAPAREVSSFLSLPLTTAGAPLYARNCALLI